MRKYFKVSIIVELDAYNPEHAALLAERPLKKALHDIENRELEILDSNGNYHYVTVKQVASKLDSEG